LTLLKARGQPVQDGDDLRVEEFNQASIDKYGDREYPIPAQFLPTSQEAIDYARYVLLLHKDISPRMSISFLASKDSDHLTEGFTRELSDRVTVKSNAATKLGIVSTPMFVERIQHDVSGGGAQHWVTLILSSGEDTAPIIVLDTGPGLDTGILGY
jgi:hypothetical protein